MVKNILSLLAVRQNSILSGAAIYMVAMLLSKLFGLIRTRLILHYFNTSDAAIFISAIKIPDMVFQLLVFGTLSVAFIPVFIDHVHKNGEEDAFRFGSNILNLSLIIFALVSLIIFIFTPFLNSILVPGFYGQQKVLTDSLTRVIIFSEIILVVGSFLTGVAQSYQRLIFPALAPLFYNLGIIFCTVAFAPLGIIAPAIGAVLGALLHVLIQVPVMRSVGFRYNFSFNFLDKSVREIFRLMSFRNISLMAEQISDVVGFNFASQISFASVTLLNVSWQLQGAPVSLFGATIAQAALPVLSREQARGELSAFKATLLTTLHQILFLTLPAAAILVVLRIPVVRLVFGASQFDWSDTVLTGRTTAFLALGLVAQSVILLFVRGFYALKDTKTPAFISLLTVLANIYFNYIFVKVFNWDVWSLGLSYAISANLSSLLLLYFLYRKLGGFDKQALTAPALKMFLAAVTAAVALYIPIKALDHLVIDTTRTLNLLFLTGIASVFGLSVYILLIWLMDVRELGSYVELLRRLARFQKKVRTEEILPEPNQL